jgi:hypothetical protein
MRKSLVLVANFHPIPLPYLDSYNLATLRAADPGSQVWQVRGSYVGDRHQPRHGLCHFSNLGREGVSFTFGKSLQVGVVLFIVQVLKV